MRDVGWTFHYCKIVESKTVVVGHNKFYLVLQLEPTMICSGATGGGYTLVTNQTRKRRVYMVNYINGREPVFKAIARFLYSVFMEY